MNSPLKKSHLGCYSLYLFLISHGPTFLCILIKGLPSSNKYNTILVVVDCLTKYALPISFPYTALKVAQDFMTHIPITLHFETMVYGHDPTFASAFWKEPFSLQGTLLAFTTLYHSKIDGQKEILNKYL